MGREKVLLENLSEVLDVFVKTSPGAIDFAGSVNKCPDETRIFKTFTKFVKTLKIQVKFILNSTRTQCDYLFITQTAKFSEHFPYMLKHNQPALRIIVKVSARKQFTKQAF